MIRSSSNSAFVNWMVAVTLAASMAGCGDPELVSADRFAEPDRLFSILDANVASSGTLEKIVEIDHARLGAEAGSVMPPARLLLFSNPGLEAELIALNPLAAIDLPLRALAYEAASDRSGKVIFNSFEYLRSRYSLGDVPEVEAKFDASMAEALQGIDLVALSSFEKDSLQADGIITLMSPFDVETTVDRLTAAIDAQDDTVWFGTVDFQARAKPQGVDVGASRMLLFGGPAPGAKAMSTAPTLGLDAFCQKLLIWEDQAGAVKVSFNDLLAMADRQNASKSLALRVINRRLKSTFEGALDL